MGTSKLTFGVTAFIDILGFGDRVLSAASTKDIRSVAASVKLIRKRFDHKTNEDYIKESHKLSSTTVLAFSDSVIVNVPLQSDITKIEGTFDPIMSEISSMALAQGQCAAEGLFIRGGLDLGWWYKDGATLVSESLTRAYKAEGSANVPVIALTPDLYKFLSEHKNRSWYSSDSDPVKRTFLRYSAAVKGKRVSFWYLDYIRIFTESIGWQTSREQLETFRTASSEQKAIIQEAGYRENVDRWFCEHARHIERAHASATSDHVRDKYIWLAQYHNKSIRRYTRNKSCKCVV
ncbi:hypothetical protein CGK74_17835 [Thauera propionica]|uniref:Uncharacterized protein n=1 Tax=Thauera propionica TaxID=2019431 RepID=A0A235EUG6_9RHOO|nr:hypothetical protein [Thauera propionica]OYD52423.1 hypothetical protein CGK74_17835 [Thauera propionica]